MRTTAFSPLHLTEGLRGRLTFRFVLPDGASEPTLRGAVAVRGGIVTLLPAGDRQLIIPELPAGVHLLEVRAGGDCILYSHVEVLPSPLAGEVDTAEKGCDIEVDLTTDLLHVEVNLAGGSSAELNAHLQDETRHLTAADRQTMHSHAGAGDGSARLGESSAADGYYSAAIGKGASVGRYATGGIALGNGVQVTGTEGMAMGHEAKALADHSAALGWRAENKDSGTLLMQVVTGHDSAGNITRALRFYLLSPGSALSSRYCEGAAGLGAVEVDATGQIVRRGTMKLFDLLTDHRDDFTPTL